MQPELALLVGSPNGSSSTILHSLGDFELDVEAAYTATDALRLLRPEHFSVAVCDLPILDMTPPGVVSGIRRASPTTSVILLAGGPNGPDLADVVQIGADEIVPRPLDRARLMEAIARALHKRRLALDAQDWRDLQAGDIKTEAEQLLMLGAVEALARCIEAKDFMSDGHSRSVSGLAHRLAQHMGLTGIDAEEARMAGVLHDLGKVAVDQEILAKPEALTPAEWHQVRLHPVAGAEIVGTMEPLENVASYIRYHHERHDGGGYPDGLGGSDIPLVSRIVAVSDAYDAMIRPRPYRRLDGLPYAAREFRANAGTQWDPDIVDGLFSCVPELQLAAAG